MHAKLLSGAPLMKNKLFLKNCLGYVKCIVSMAAHNAILKNSGVPTKYSYLSSISSLNNIRGTNLNLIAFTHWSNMQVF